MKLFNIVLFLSLNSLAQSNAQASSQILCDAPTEEHPELKMSLDAGSKSASVAIVSNDGSAEDFSAVISSKIETELLSQRLSQAAVLIGTHSGSHVSSDRTAFNPAMSLVLEPKSTALPKKLRTTLTLHNLVFVYTCQKK